MDFRDPTIHTFLPSLQPQYIRAYQQPLSDFGNRTRYGSDIRSPSDFNFFSGLKPWFEHPYGLYSAGHAELDLDKASLREKAIWNRNKVNTFLVTDSGGFQISQNAWHVDESKEKDDRLREKVLRWQEAISDLAIILDMPTRNKDPQVMISFDRCLTWAQDSLRYYADNATGGVPFLNVIQGGKFEEYVAWYEATNWFPAVGWCIAGVACKNLWLMLRILMHMDRDDAFERQ